MKKISKKELGKLAEIIRQVEIEKNNKQVRRFLNRLKALNKKYDTNELRQEVLNLIELVNMKEPMSLELRSLRSLLNTNLDVNFIANKVMGLYLPLDRQLIPEPIPIHIIDTAYTNENKARVLKVEFPGFEEEEIAHWQNLGFYQAISLPYEHREIKGISVLIVKPLLPSNSEAGEHGFSPSLMGITDTPTPPQLWRLVRDSIEMKKSSRSRNRFGRRRNL